MPFVNNSSIAAGVATGDFIPVADLGGKRRTAMAVFTCAADAVGTYTVPIRLPRGARVVECALNTSVTFGATATIAIGIAGTVGKYRAAATLTAVDQWVTVALNAAVGVALAAEEQIIMTVAAAALPASGRLVVRFDYVDNS